MEDDVVKCSGAFSKMENPPINNWWENVGEYGKSINGGA